MTRIWNVRSSKNNSIVVAVHPFKGRIFNGVIIGPLSIEQIAEIDKREVDYSREKMREDQIVEFGIKGNIWVYTPQKECIRYPTVEVPILQSYVDVIIKGCLERGGKEFAKDFIRTTYGWENIWINDRGNSNHTRSVRLSDSDSLALEIDSLLMEIEPYSFSKRLKI
jgi:hypothetical protein